MSYFRAVLAGCLVMLVAVARGQQPQPTPMVIPTWKDLIAKNYLPYHQLKVEDFPIEDKAHPKMAWFLQPFIRYYYHYLSNVVAGGMVYVNVPDWTVFSGFDKNLSSRNSKFPTGEMKNQLPYAQALFDIAEIHSRGLASLKAGELPSGQGKTFEEARAQLEDKLAAFMQMRFWEGQKETDALAKATNNGLNKKKVREVAAPIKKRLTEIPPGVPPPGAEPSVTP